MEMRIGNQKVTKVLIGGQVLYDQENEWQILTGSSDFFTSYTMLYRIHREERYIEATIGGKTQSDLGAKTVFIDLSNMVSKITKCSFVIARDTFISTQTVSLLDGARLYTNANNGNGYGAGYTVSSVGQDGGPFVKIYYDKLVKE
ncbi:hypothetical protein [Levilactobacillus wangkuiensis]|uniref:hypothetical protein n=1 Tax=Levilactobacillus wangkuiensis TaxID=2799566 RepID=UPI001941C798|nr:hypothetical protein [Levilactobacillus wangkuiensis]